MISHLDHIRSYYEALNTGDAELVAGHFTDDATHYYTRLGPHEGAERIGQNSKLGVEMIDGQWYIEHGIEQDDEAVIEWTMTWRDPKSGEKRLDRGTEWFQMRDGKIAEVRAYHHGGKKNPQGDLLGFDHKERGYTMLEDWEGTVTVIKDTGKRAILPPFSEEHEELRETIDRWVREEIAPHVDEWEQAREFPRELYTRAAELGFLGLKYPVELGGQGGDYLHDAVWAEQLARGGSSGGVGAGLGAHTGIATPPIFKFGTDDQKQRFLVPAIKGEKICALGITEPGAGSDVAGISTFARKVDGGYVVNGSKTFITNGVRADLLVCAVKTTEQGGHQGISFLILEREMPGYEVAAKLEKMGWHASDTGELSFTDVEVPEENLLGGENEGFKLIMANFQWERLLMALGAVGAMQRLIEVTVEYAKERQAFGRPIGSFQAIRHKIAEMATVAEAGKAMTYNALRLFHDGHDAIKEVTEAKLFTQRQAVEVADECLQIHGGYGYMREYGIERAVRDLRLGPIGGGTDEVMKEILGKQLGL